MLLKISILIAKLSGFASKLLLRKSGATIPGKVLLQLYPRAIRNLSRNRTVILVSGTNGKTSTTRALTKIVSSLGSTVSNSTGSNLDRGAATALLNAAQYAVLEVDELHLTKVALDTTPKVILLLNLSRDQLHRMHEVKRVSDRWNQLAKLLPETVFVGDIDDPFVAHALSGATNAVRVSFGGRRHLDAGACPSCGAYLKWIGGSYSCVCGLSNARADKKFSNGSAAYRNAVLANVAGEIVGAQAIEVSEAELERTVSKDFTGVMAKLRLTKNPASWVEALSGVTSSAIVLIVNAREVDGIDTSWLWDIDFSSLKGKEIVVTGERALDISYRLHVQGIKSEVAKNFELAIKTFKSGESVDVLCAYTAFFELAGR